jgi:hypothetical protein
VAAAFTAEAMTDDAAGGREHLLAVFEIAAFESRIGECTNFVERPFFPRSRGFWEFWRSVGFASTRGFNEQTVAFTGVEEGFVFDVSQESLEAGTPDHFRARSNQAKKALRESIVQPSTALRRLNA